MWTKIVENAKLILSTGALVISLVVGAWTSVTTIFITKAEAKEMYQKFDIDSSYNKAFRLESQIRALEEDKAQRDLSDSEKTQIKRLKKNLERVDKHIADLEDTTFGD